MEISSSSDICEEVIESIQAAVIVDDQFLRTILSGILARGHVLVEDVPGTGKTLTARNLATALGLSFKRIQFTPDLLPGDITGSNVFNELERTFEFNPGPVFANVVLADEINRAPPKTQAALLEAMEEKQVTVDGNTHTLPDPFIVMATQNPIEHEGTFNLPEAQLDRFIVKTEMGYPDRDGELELINRRASRTQQTLTVDPVIDSEVFTQLQSVIEDVRFDPKLRGYVVDLGRASRSDDRIDVGVSPRGIQRLFEVSRAQAMLEGREFVSPNDIKTMARPVFRHRILLTTEARVRGVDRITVLEDVLDSVTVPAVTEP